MTATVMIILCGSWVFRLGGAGQDDVDEDADRELICLKFHI